MSSPNIDPAEIHHFEALAQQWWAPAGAFKTLHAVNPLRLAFIAQQAELRHQQVIDVGCGGGILTESLAACDAQLTGIDMSASAIEVARQHAQSAGICINYLQATVEEMAQQHPEQFDVVTCMEMLEHVPDPLSVVKSCARLAKPQGHVFFSTLNRDLKAYLQAIVAAEYILKLVPRGLHRYEQFIKPAELASWARSADLEVVKMAGIGYNPISKQYSLTQNVAVNYLMHTQKRA